MKIIIAILIFGILVLIHELGHFIFARLHGIEVVDFSIGMGPRLCGFRAFGTQFSVRLLPIGGACMMLGEDQDQNMDNERSFYAKNVWQRVSVLFAGPGFNFLLAFIFTSREFNRYRSQYYFRFEACYSSTYFSPLP